jgi:hypothetical protein
VEGTEQVTVSYHRLERNFCRAAVSPRATVPSVQITGKSYHGAFGILDLWQF